MALRIPRGYAVNRPYFREVCEGTRPNSQAAPRLPWTGLAHVRTDEVHHDPIVIDAGTLVGVIQGGTGAAQVGGTTGYFVPAFVGAGNIVTTGVDGAATTGGLTYPGMSSTVNNNQLYQVGSSEAATTWGLWNTSGTVKLGSVLPMGVVTQPVYSSYLPIAFTNYKRQHSIGFVTEYVIQVPATNDEEVLIKGGERVMLGSGVHHGIGCNDPYAANKQAGRYARYAPAGLRAEERRVGVCLKRTKLGSASNGAAAVGQLLASNLATFTADADLAAEFAGLERVQTVPGLSLSGSETKGVPAFLLGARADGDGNYWALTILIRII